MVYSENPKTYTFHIYDGNCLCDDCFEFEETDECLTFTGTLQEFGEQLEYGDFLQEDIKSSIEEFEKHPKGTGYLPGKKYDSIGYETVSD